MTDPRPFLPEPDPEPVAPPKNKQARKTLALWMLLILMFLGIWQFLQPSPSERHARPAPPPCEEQGLSYWSALTTVVPIGFAFLFFFVFLRRYQAVEGFNRQEEPGQLALAEGRFSAAIDTFRACAERSKGKVSFESFAWFNVGYAQRWAGDFDGAIETMKRVEKTFGLPRAHGIRLRAAQELALLYALKGDLSASTQWVNDTNERLKKTGEIRLHAAASLCITEAIVMTRGGHAASAIASLDKAWFSLRTGDANTMRVAEVVRAFAETGGGPRQYNTVQERIVRVEPVAGNEFAFLGIAWPEMQTFLVAHQLVKATAAS